MANPSKILSYNVNGIRAAMKKGLIDWISAAQPDVLCLQEVKALQEQVDLTPLQEMGYEAHWFSAEKKGYSGVAILTRITPTRVVPGMGMEVYDREGRVIRADYDDFSVISVYMPSGSSGEERQAFKMQWLTDFGDYIADLRKVVPNLIISGDYNICHEAIDIHNPVSNKNSSGFLPEERQWMSDFIATGMIDTFRMHNPDPHNYTWWSYRAGARGKNLGWRIDYHMATESLRKRVTRSGILSDALHSDHCPILVEIA